MKKNMTVFVCMCLLCLSVWSCGGEEATPSAPAETPAAAAPAPAPSPFTASKIAVPLASASGDHIRAALVGGGWEMASLSSSGSITTAMARKNGTSATVYFYNPAKAHHRGHLERDTKAIHAEGNVLIGVRMEGNDAGALALLTSLIGHPPAAAAAPAPPAAPPTPATPTPPPATPPVAAAPTGGWDGQSPLSCGGVQQMTIANVTANLPGVTAISAAGTCQLTLINCNITAGTPIEAAGMARVIVQGGRLQGSQASISASGRANVAVNGAEVVGRVSRSGVATVTGAQ